ncbi:MAG: GNAT family N-acetyltransferase [Deltaproteobacteria bacterium]|nr:GNAT family N-acetyltransferase [Deltaproteobacteria bacterium]
MAPAVRPPDRTDYFSGPVPRLRQPLKRSAEPSLTIVPIEGKAGLKAFIRFPWSVYRGDPAWVPPLIRERKEYLDPTKNPLFRHAAVRLFLARWEGVPVGRIAAVVNHHDLRYLNEKVGYFGLFETLPDLTVARALLERAAGWLREQGMAVMRGPVSLSVHDEVGLLVQGFETPPMVLMSHNPPYYAQMLEQFGCSKVRDLYAYLLTATGPVAPAAVDRVAELVARRGRITIRTLRMAAFTQEVELIQRLYNEAWASNWGFVPMAPEDVAFMAARLKPLVDPELVLIGEINGEPAGFALSLPDYNLVLKRMNGRLLPFGIVHFLLGRRRLNRLRIIALGIRPTYRKSGLEALLYAETWRRGVARGFFYGEVSWVLEDNHLMRRAAEKLGGELYKVYRIYDYPLS